MQLDQVNFEKNKLQGVFKKLCNSTIKKNGNVTNYTLFFSIIPTEFNAFATFVWHNVKITIAFEGVFKRLWILVNIWRYINLDLMWFLTRSVGLVDGWKARWYKRRAVAAQTARSRCKVLFIQAGRRCGSRVYWRCWCCTWLWPINCDVSKPNCDARVSANVYFLLTGLISWLYWLRSLCFWTFSFSTVKRIKLS